ncbi:MAG: phosphatase PAP2 family protein [Bacteroidales bacterium]|nr:phosphatase PAP2 family protein [Bacteroidales bacterium]
MNPIVELDEQITLAVNSWNTESLDPFFFYVSYRWLWIGIGAVLLFFVFKKAKPEYKKAVIFLLFLAVAVLAADQICNVVKHSVQRFRPCWDERFMDFVHIVNNDRGGKYGFFSAHAATFFAIAFLTMKYFQNRKFTVLIYSVAVLVSYSRIYLGRHYLGDIICGAVEGTLIAWCAYYFYQKFLGKYMQKHQKN